MEIVVLLDGDGVERMGRSNQMRQWGWWGDWPITSCYSWPKAG